MSNSSMIIGQRKVRIEQIKNRRIFKVNKLGRVMRMIVDAILTHAESGPNDHRKDAPPFKNFTKVANPFEIW